MSYPTQPNVAKFLKENYPKTWEKFKDYLRENYEFWEKEHSEKTLWFCDRDFKMQLGYYLGWFEELNIVDEPIPPAYERSPESPIEIMIIMIVDVFKYLEDKS